MRRITLALCLALAGCGSAEPEPGRRVTISDETFLEVFVALQEARARAASAAEFDSLKREILGGRGLTEEDLLRYAEVRGRDIDRMVELMDTVTARLARRGEEGE